ncbi:MAG: hypothetical protein Q8R49_01280, partial [Rhodoferax sp.]|nr:hypothetical protein [Rhodoferax sp.]
MSLILHSNATSGQAAVARSRAPAPRDEQARQQPLSFEEVLVRSLTVDLETAEKVAVKTPPSAPTRRQSVERKDDPAELANAITLTMVALDGGSIKIAGKDLPEGHADDQASLSQGSQPAGPQTLAPDRAALASTTRRPGLRLAPAMTTPAAMTAATAVEAMAVQARPSAAGANSTATTGARPTALQGEPALPAKQQLDGQATLQVTLAAASDKPALAPGAGTLSAQVSLPAYGNADQASDGAAGSANSRSPMAVMSASLTAAVASSILPVDAHAGPKRLAPDAGPGTSMRRGQG